MAAQVGGNTTGGKGENVGVDKVLELANELRGYVERLKPEEARIVLEQLRQLEREIEARLGAAKGKGVGGKLRRAFSKLVEQQLLAQLGELRQQTAEELPDELLELYGETIRQLTPVDEARIRLKLIAVRNADQVAYQQLLELLHQPPPWNVWTVAVLDRAANGRTDIPINLKKLYTMYKAYQTRDPWYLVLKLSAQGEQQLATLLQQLINDANMGDQEAVKKLTQILKLAYTIPPPHEWKEYTLLTRTKIHTLRNILTQKTKTPS